MMLNEVCLEINNFFNRNQPIIIGDLRISNGKITDTDFLNKIKENQYFRIVGSVFNDGVYQYTTDLTLLDEDFHGAFWLMAVPKDFLDLVDEITTWQNTNGSADSIAMSPFQSESFGGYSYSKSSGSNGENSSASVPTWQSRYASRLNPYRRINVL
jgi:hypothetical protein